MSVGSVQNTWYHSQKNHTSSINMLLFTLNEMSVFKCFCFATTENNSVVLVRVLHVRFSLVLVLKGESSFS